MYRVVISNDGNETEIHSPYTNDLKLLVGIIKKGINTFESFDFSILPNNPGIGKLRPFKTLVNVIDTIQDKDIFRGQLLIPSNSMESDGTFGYDYVCASTLSFLQDSIQDYAKIQNTSPEQFFRYLIDVHNSKVKEPHKKFVVGRVNVTNSTDNVYRYVDETKTTYETIKEKLIDRIGGEIQVRYENGINYIDYLVEIGHVSETTIEVEKNMISFSKQVDPTDVVTVFKPRGARPETTGEEQEGDYNAAEPRLTISSINGGKDYILASQDLIDEFGYKEGSISYDDINNAQILLTRGNQFMASQKAALVKYTLSAVDLSLLGIDPESYEIGNYYPVKNRYMGIEENLRTVGVTLDIINPEISSMTIGDKAKSLSQYQKEANEISRNYKEIQQNVINLSNSNIALNKSLEKTKEDLTNVMNQLTEVDFENLPEELKGISAQLVDIKQELNDLDIPVYGPVTVEVAGLMIPEDKTKLDNLSDNVATTTKNGLMSKEDKTSLNKTVADIGNKALLTTVNKTDLVAAINELNAKLT